jgi:hypothetical protein
MEYHGTQLGAQVSRDLPGYGKLPQLTPEGWGIGEPQYHACPGNETSVLRLLQMTIRGPGDKNNQ